jgi:hypothetical protein
LATAAAGSAAGVGSAGAAGVSDQSSDNARLSRWVYSPVTSVFAGSATGSATGAGAGVSVVAARKDASRQRKQEIVRPVTHQQLAPPVQLQWQWPRW